MENNKNQYVIMLSVTPPEGSFPWDDCERWIFEQVWRFLPAADADEDEAELAELLEELLLLLVLPPPPELEDDVFPLAPKHEI